MSSDNFSVKDKIVCVTGVSSGIGRAIASDLAASGAHVVGIARRKDALKDWQSNTSGETAILDVDLSKIEDLPAVAKQASGFFGGISILINAAGLNPRVSADEVSNQAWQDTLDINLSAPFFLAQNLVPFMKSQKWGRIINFASLQSTRAFKNGIAYGTSKGGVTQMTRAMAEAWSKDGITANAIAPGFFPTELTAAVFDDAELAKKNAEQTCIGRNGNLDDLFGPVHFFCSEASRYVTGQTLAVDGGFTAK